MIMMRMNLIVLLLHLSVIQLVDSNDTDQFNYRGTSGTDYGPEDWSEITCTNPGECQGWPDSWELGVSWELGSDNNCVSCPADRNNTDNRDCRMHRQSPIDLERTLSTTGHDTECYDYHWMAYQDGSCNWHDMIKNGLSRDMNNFKIERHALQILQPIDDDGTLQCDDQNGRNFPRLDYSKGFPDWWFLSHTEVTVPSEHTQHGKRYDAEVHLSHFYSVEHERKIGKVALLLQADPNIDKRWDFLDKMICQWREAEEKTRDECQKESAPPYPGCRNPNRSATETNLVNVNPYPFIDCDSVNNSERICKPTSCCEEVRSTTRYCANDVYGKYGEEMTGSICWWCCPGKILAPDPATTGSGQQPSTVEPYFTSASTITPTTSKPMPSVESQLPAPAPSLEPQPAPALNLQPTPPPILPCRPNNRRKGKDTQKKIQCPHKEKEFTKPPTALPTPIPQVPVPVPSQRPDQLPTQQPVKLPTQVTNISLPVDSGPSTRCLDYKRHDKIKMDRICKIDGCCDSVRSASEYCHSMYSFFGGNMGEICTGCCQKKLAPPPPLHDTHQPIDCSTIDSPFRICKPSSCCDEVKSTTSFCEDKYKKYGDQIGSICWYCCSQPKEVDPSLLSINAAFPSPPTTSGAFSLPTKLPSFDLVGKKAAPRAPTSAPTLDYKSDVTPKAEVSSISSRTEKLSNSSLTSFWNNSRRISSSDNAENDESMAEKATEDTFNANLLNGHMIGYHMMDPSNFVVNENAEAEHLADIENHRKRKKDASAEAQRLNELRGDNYRNVIYSPYEWMREVKTEYYYRYEGSQMVPPCYGTVHYRVMKDPIRIHPIQLAELERLLAWRIAPKGSEFNECSPDTAGRQRPDSNGNAVDLNRPIQEYHNIHRKVFCECKDWKSKWEEDQDWCKLSESERENSPYNFDSNGY